MLHSKDNLSDCNYTFKESFPLDPENLSVFKAHMKEVASCRAVILQMRSVDPRESLRPLQQICKVKLFSP